jgi:hypothetical protein
VRPIASVWGASIGSDDLEDRTSLLRRVVQYELPLEDTLVLLRAYGWGSDEELVTLTAEDVIHLLDRFFAGELTVEQVQHWAELLELRDDVGFEPRWSEHLALAVKQLASPETFGPITPSLLRRIRHTFAGEAA